MSFLTAKEKSTKYHAEEKAADWALDWASDEQLQKWETDPDCIEKGKCAAYLAERLAKRASDVAELERATAAEQEEQRRAGAAKREELQDNPFDPRTEVSADAKHIAGRIVKMF